MRTELLKWNNASPQIFRVVVTLSLAILFLGWVVILFFYLQQVGKKLNHEYIQNARLENQLNDLLSNLQDAETGQRGYLLTFNDSYLDPYHTAVQSNQQILLDITQNIEKEGLDTVRLGRLRHLIEGKYAELAQTISLSKDGRHSEAIDLVNTDEGKLLMDSIRVEIQFLRISGKEKLHTIEKDTERLYRISNSLIIGFGVLVLALLLYVFLWLRPLFLRLDEINRMLVESNKLIASKNQQLEEFAYITSHDLKEPLRTISNFVKLFEKQYATQFDDKARQYFSFILGATRRMERMISSILNYSKLGGGVAFVQVDVNQMVEAVVKDLSLAISESRAKIKYDRLPKIIATETEIRLLFQNLISNAIKFRRKDVPPVIQISCIEDDLYWRFFVSDNGIGIPENKLTHIFGFFTRLHSTSDYEGQGIGLAFCKKIVEMYDGNIEVQSKLGEGSTFSFNISKHLRGSKASLRPESTRLEAKARS